MKIKKLNAKGFSHHIVLATVVVLVAIVGTYYLVASHADSPCPVTSGTVSSVSGSGCVTSAPGAGLNWTLINSVNTAGNHKTTVSFSACKVATGTSAPYAMNFLISESPLIAPYATTWASSSRLGLTKSISVSTSNWSNGLTVLTTYPTSTQPYVEATVSTTASSNSTLASSGFITAGQVKAC